MNVLIIGATSGIGYELWKYYITQGNSVAITGYLVSITSVGGLQPTPIAPSYSASKAFQINYTKSIQLKSKGTSIVVTEIRPGLVDTGIAKGEGLFWVMPLDKVVKKIVKAIKLNKKKMIVTRRWRLINWLLRHFA